MTTEQAYLYLASISPQEATWILSKILHHTLPLPRHLTAILAMVESWSESSSTQLRELIGRAKSELIELKFEAQYQDKTDVARALAATACWHLAWLPISKKPKWRFEQGLKAIAEVTSETLRVMCQSTREAADAELIRLIHHWHAKLPLRSCQRQF